MIRVLIVEDSPTQRLLVRSVLEYDPEMRVVGEARNGEEAVSLCHELQPDVITMDIRMPRLNGFEATRRIMQEFSQADRGAHQLSVRPGSPECLQSH